MNPLRCHSSRRGLGLGLALALAATINARAQSTADTTGAAQALSDYLAAAGQDGGRLWGLSRDPELQIWTALDDAPLSLTDHRLVNLRFAVADVRREADGRTYHALVRFRAVTEPM